MKVDWTLGAISDLTAIYQHIGSESPRYALTVVDRMTRRTRQLAAFPWSGGLVPEYQREDIREVLEYSYRIIYQVGDAKLLVIAVIHAASTMPEAPPAE
ncbi:MAG: type II toxin-antitoxin system RelE/ParE family toxin [Planctomycetota bacterium]